MKIQIEGAQYELKLTSAMMCEAEDKIGMPLLKYMEKVAKTKEFGIKEMLILFWAELNCGDNEISWKDACRLFDAWGLSFQDKTMQILSAVKLFLEGMKSKN